MLTETDNQPNQKVVNIMTYKVLTNTHTHTHTHTHVYIPKSMSISVLISKVQYHNCL